MNSRARRSWTRSVGVAAVVSVPLLIIAGYLFSRTEKLDAGIAFALRPKAAVSSRTNLIYPPDTRLYLSRDSKDDLVWVGRSLSLTSPPDVSFDGKKLLFSARESSKGIMGLFETDSDGRTLHRVAVCESDCSTPVYLPDGGVAFSMMVSGGGGNPTSSVFVTDSNKKQVRRITFNEGLWVVQRVLPDGRILIRKLDSGGESAQLLAVRRDGTELEEYLSTPSSNPRFPGNAQCLGSGSEDVEELLARARAKQPHSLTTWPSGYEPTDPVRIQARSSPPKETSVVLPELGYGWILCLNVYESTLRIVRGSVKTVRVWDQRTGSMLGQAAVEEDGSFFLKVPADRLLLLELVDSQGRPLVRQRSGIWVRPNERRGCIGCHESRYLAPENRSPLAVAKGPTEIGGVGGGS